MWGAPLWPPPCVRSSTRMPRVAAAPSPWTRGRGRGQTTADQPPASVPCPGLCGGSSGTWPTPTRWARCRCGRAARCSDTPRTTSRGGAWWCARWAASGTSTSWTLSTIPSTTTSSRTSAIVRSLLHWKLRVIYITNNTSYFIFTLYFAFTKHILLGLHYHY